MGLRDLLDPEAIRVHGIQAKPASKFEEARPGLKVASPVNNHGSEHPTAGAMLSAEISRSRKKNRWSAAMNEMAVIRAAKSEYEMTSRARAVAVSTAVASSLARTQTASG